MGSGAILSVHRRSGVLQHFFHGGVAVEHAADAVLAEGAHAQLAGAVADDQGRLLLGDQLADGLGDLEVLVDPAAALVADAVQQVQEKPPLQQL